MLIFEATAVEPRGRISSGDLGLYSADCEEALGRVVVYCRQYGSALLGIQLAHAGRKGSCHIPWESGKPLRSDEGAWETLAPSALPFDEGWHKPKEMTANDMRVVRAAFAASAARAERLGFDLVELHVAHGYLLHEFISPLSNKRDDMYGGSLENRLRFPLEVAGQLRAVWPKNRILEARITGSDWIDGGVTPHEAAVFASNLKDLGFDFVSVSSGGVVPHAVIPAEPNYQLPFAVSVRREADIATCGIGLIASPLQADAIIATEQSDLVALARAFLDNPHWGWIAAAELAAQVERPPQYKAADPKYWPGATISRDLD